MAFTKIAAAGIGSTGTVTLENLVVTGSLNASSITGAASSTTNIPNLSGAITSNNTTTSLGSFTSAQLATALTDETGSGANVFATSPTLITPALGAATATSLVVSGISTLGNVVVGGGTTQLIVTGNARITGILTVGTSSITLDGSNNQINVGTGVTLSSSAINVTGIITATTFTIGAGTTALPSISPSGDSNTGIFFPAADTIAFSEGGAEAMRVDSSGRLLVGTSTSRVDGAGGASSKIQIADVGGVNGGISNFYYSPDGGVNTFNFCKSRGATEGSFTIVNSGDSLGLINWIGADGNGFTSTAARIGASVDGTPGANDMPGRLVFSTTADGAASPTERMRIASNGKIQASAGTNWAGTVSQSGTSAVIEQGSNANGIFTKFADGTMLCGRTIGADDGAGSGTWTFPVAFSAAPHISNSGCRTIQGGVGEGSGVIVPNGNFPVSTTEYIWAHIRLVGYGNIARFFAQRAYGRWY